MTFFGDMGTPDFEYIDVFVEGTDVGRLTSSAFDCGGDTTTTLSIPTDVLEDAAADGKLTVTFLDGGNEINNFCGTRDSAAFSYDNSTDIVFGPTGTAFAVLGTLTVDTDTSEDVAVNPEATLLSNRAAMVLAHGLDSSRRIKRLTTGTAVTRENLSFDGATLIGGMSGGLNVTRDGLDFRLGEDFGSTMLWAEGSFTVFEDNLVDDGRFGILHVGADWKWGDRTMIGISAQLDDYSHDETDTGNEASGTGWMLGPVLTHALTDELFIDARLAWGEASNDIEGAEGSASFDSERALAEVSLTGRYGKGAYTFFPEAEIAWFRESSDAFTSDIGASDGYEVSIAQARIGTLIERSFDLNATRSATAFADVRAVYSETVEGSLAVGSFADEVEGMSGEVEVGMSLLLDGGTTFDASIGTGGLFADADSYTASVALRIPTK